MAQDDLSNTILGVTWMEAVLATAFTLLRLYTRTRVEPNLGWDDWTMILSLTMSLTANAVLSVGVHYGLGQHAASLPPHRVAMAMEMQWIQQFIAVLANSVARISISILLIRLFPTKKLMKHCLIWMAVINTLLGVVGVVLIFSQCSPSSRLWDEQVEGHCLPPYVQVNMATTKGAFSILCDLITVIWPIAIIWSLHMAFRTKLFLAGLFMLTSVAVITTIFEVTLLNSNAIHEDQTYGISQLVIWIYSTENVLVIVGNIPTLVPLWRRAKGQTSSSRWHGYGSRGPTSSRKTTDNGGMIAKRYEPMGSTERGAPSEDYILDAIGEINRSGEDPPSTIMRDVTVKIEIEEAAHAREQPTHPGEAL